MKRAQSEIKVRVIFSGFNPRPCLALLALVLTFAFSGPVYGKLGPEIPDFSARDGEPRSRFSAEATFFHSSVHIAGPYFLKGHDAKNYQLFLDGRLNLGRRVCLEARLPYQALNRREIQAEPNIFYNNSEPETPSDWASGFGDFEARMDILIRTWDADQGGLALVAGIRFATLDSDFPKLDKLEYYPESNGSGLIVGYRFSKTLHELHVRLNFRNTLRFHPSEDDGRKTGDKLDYVLGLHPVSLPLIEGLEVKLHGTFANLRDDPDRFFLSSRPEDAYNDLGHALNLQPSYAFNARGAFPVRLGTSLPIYASADSYVGKGWNVFLSFQFRGWRPSR